MPNYGEAHAALIQAVVDDSKVVAQKMGTVVSRATAGAAAVVSFDGSSGLGQPVKCFESVVVAPGDRVGLIKFEGDWVIVGNYSTTLWADGLQGFAFTSTSTTTSATFVDMPGSPTIAVQKARDVTQFQLNIQLSCRSAAAASTIMEFSFLIHLPDGVTTYESAIIRRVFNTADAHQDMAGGVTTNLTLPAGAYTLTARWRRVSGTGTPTTDVNDSVTMRVKEVTG